MIKIETSVAKSPSDACHSSPGLARSTLSIPELNLDPFLSQKKVSNPRIEYASKLRKRVPSKATVSIADLKDSLAKFELKRTKSFEQSITVFYKVEEQKETSSNHQKAMAAKVDSFLLQLKSTNPDDIRLNSEILGDLLVSFAATFQTDVDKLVDVILDQKAENINMATLRSLLTDLVSKQ